VIFYLKCAAYKSTYLLTYLPYLTVFHLLLRPRRRLRFCFCLSVCQQDNSKRCRRILMNFFLEGWDVWLATNYYISVVILITFRV